MFIVACADFKNLQVYNKQLVSFIVDPWGQTKLALYGRENNSDSIASTIIWLLLIISISLNHGL